MESENTSKYIIMVHYLSKRNGETRPLLVMPEVLRSDILEANHENMGHMGVDKTCNLIIKKYFWPRLYKEVMALMGHCVTCQAQSRKWELVPLMETDVPYFPFQKVSMNISVLTGKLFMETYIS